MPKPKPPSAPVRKRRASRPAQAPAASAPPTVAVGQRLSALRTERRLSLRALAEHSGLNVNTLSLIEHGKTSPSVSTLQQLAQALQVSIVAFFETEAPRQRIVYTPARERPANRLAHGTLADLGAGLAGRSVEPFVLALEPNTGSGPQPIVHTGHEFVYCLKGRLLYTLEDQTYLLTAGDSLLFEAHLPHRWQNVDVDPTEALLVLCPADTRDEPVALHFAPSLVQARQPAGRES